MEKVKPYLKYITTVDFGKVTYQSEFESFLADNKLKINIFERCSGNFFLKLFNFYIYETEAISNWYSFKILSIKVKFDSSTNLILSKQIIPLFDDNWI